MSRTTRMRITAKHSRWEDMMGNASNLAATLLLFGAVMGTSPALAEMPAEGAYEQLSPGHQKMARALYDAQVAKPTTTPVPPTSKSSTTGPKPLTLDQIAAMKQSGQGWADVFRVMKTQGLVQEKNLGQVVIRAHRAEEAQAVTTTGKRATPVTRPAHVVGAERESTPSASPVSANRSHSLAGNEAAPESNQ
jgi:hypothetical protein